MHPMARIIAMAEALGSTGIPGMLALTLRLPAVVSDFLVVRRVALPVLWC